MPLGMDAGLGLRDIVFDVNSATHMAVKAEVMYLEKLCCKLYYKSSAVAEMGDRCHNKHGPKRGGAVPLTWSARKASTTMWPAPRSTSVPSGVFIHPAVWPQ